MLAARLRALDQDAWALLYDEHQPRIWRYCYARTGSRDAADDLAAQVFAEALQSIHRYRYRGKPILAWLYRIASNHVGKWFRQASRGNSSGEWARPGDLLDQRLASVTLGEALWPECGASWESGKNSSRLCRRNHGLRGYKHLELMAQKSRGSLGVR